MNNLIMRTCKNAQVRRRTPPIYPSKVVYLQSLLIRFSSLSCVLIVLITRNKYLQAENVRQKSQKMVEKKTLYHKRKLLINFHLLSFICRFFFLYIDVVGAAIRFDNYVVVFTFKL